MRKFTCVLFMVVAAALARAQAAAPGVRTTQPDYYPLTEGTKWHYRSRGTVKVDGTTRSRGALPVTTQIAKVERVNGRFRALQESVVTVKVSEVERIVVKGVEHLSSDDKGVWRERLGGVKFTPPLCILKYPVKVGEKWESEITIGEEKERVVCRVGREEEVEVPAGKFKTVSLRVATEKVGTKSEVPAGKFKAVSLRVEMETAGTKSTATFWYAAGVGIVKATWETGDFGGTLELEKFEPGK